MDLRRRLGIGARPMGRLSRRRRTHEEGHHIVDRPSGTRPPRRRRPVLLFAGPISRLVPSGLRGRGRTTERLRDHSCHAVSTPAGAHRQPPRSAAHRLSDHHANQRRCRPGGVGSQPNNVEPRQSVQSGSCAYHHNPEVERPSLGVCCHANGAQSPTACAKRGGGSHLAQTPSRRLPDPSP
jgi:hypothetical protein